MGIAMKRNRRLVLVGVAVLALAAWFLYGRIFSGAPETPQQGGTMPALVATAHAATFNPVYHFTGRLEAVTEAEIRPQVSGMVESIHFKEGDMVKAGQPLATIDLRNFRAQLAQGQAAAEQARLAYERGVKLREQDAISQADLDNRKAAWKTAEAQNTEARVNMDFAVVKAPIDGRVGRPEITVGNVVNAGGGAPLITTIQQVDPVYVDFEVNEDTYLHLLSTGPDGAPVLRDAPVAVGLADSGDDYPLQAHLSAVDNRFGDQSGSLRMRATLANPNGALLPGLFARVALTVPVSQTAVLVNDAAIGTDQANRFVYKVAADGTVAYQKVELGDMANGLRVITSGLRDGDRIVVNGLLRIHPGVKVQPMEADMHTTQAVSGTAPAASPTTAGIADDLPSPTAPSGTAATPSGTAE
jgi:multidrug efflux system membrane fusion protein